MVPRHWRSDIRSVYLPFIDTFYLKSLNGIDNFHTDKIMSPTYKIIHNNRIDKLQIKTNMNIDYFHSTPELHHFDEIIFCTGWGFDSSIFEFNIDLCNNQKFPSINYNYESTNNQNLFFIGALMHSQDYGKSSGGFIHGFRYLIKLFTQLNYNISLNTKEIYFDGTMKCYTILAEHIHYRINNSSSLYQLFGLMCDVFYFDKQEKKIYYIHDIKRDCIKYIPQLDDIENINVLMLEYGENVTNLDKLGGFNKYNPSLLHPKMYIYNKNRNGIILNDRVTFDENIIAEFNDNHTFNRIIQTLKMCNLIF